MKGLVSFCLFGDDPNDIYYQGAIENAKKYWYWQPDWDLWFYVGKSVPDRVIAAIRAVNDNTHFEFVDEPENQTSTHWRFRALWHSNHDFIIFRDTDSRPCDREKAAVEEWLRSDYPYHTMRDHQFHGRPLLAGMWGIKRTNYSEATTSLPYELGQNEDFYGVDQIALQIHVWPHCKRKIMVHIGSYHIYEKMAQRRPFTVPRRKDGFVAQGFNGDGSIRYPGHELHVDSDEELRARDDIFLEEYRVSRTMPA